jgi:hypothetical protein
MIVNIFRPLARACIKTSLLFHAKDAKVKRKNRRGLKYRMLFCELCGLTLRSLRELNLLIQPLQGWGKRRESFNIWLTKKTFAKVPDWRIFVTINLLINSINY